MQPNQPTDIAIALELLTEAANGRAFAWDVKKVADRAPPGLKRIDSIQINASMPIGGKVSYWITAYASDYANEFLSHGSPTLSAAITQAVDALAKMPLADDFVRMAAE